MNYNWKNVTVCWRLRQVAYKEEMAWKHGDIFFRSVKLFLLSLNTCTYVAYVMCITPEQLFSRDVICCTSQCGINLPHLSPNVLTSVPGSVFFPQDSWDSFSTRCLHILEVKWDDKRQFLSIWQRFVDFGLTLLEYFCESDFIPDILLPVWRGSSRLPVLASFEFFRNYRLKMLAKRLTWGRAK